MRIEVGEIGKVLLASQVKGERLKEAYTRAEWQDEVHDSYSALVIKCTSGQEEGKLAYNKIKKTAERLNGLDVDGSINKASLIISEAYS